MRNNKTDDRGSVLLGCLLLLTIFALIAAVLLLAVAFLSWVICMAFSLSWSWMLPFGIWAVIAMLWILSLIFK